jgi:hypothetical protein
MKLARDCQGLNSRALQVQSKRLHLPPHIRKVSISELRYDQPASLYVDFDAVQGAGKVVQYLIRSVQTLQPSGVVPLVEAFGTKQQMKAA